jgi:hypothetical protein
LMKRSVHSVLAVGVGLAVIIALSNGTDTVLELTGVYPSVEEQRWDGFDTPWMLATALAYRVMFAVIGGYATARLAPARPAAHVTALLVIGCLLGLGGLAAASGVTPLWFSLAVLILTPLAVWVGGRVHGRPRRRLPNVAEA